MPWGAIVRGGLVFGVIAGLFGMAVELMSALIGREVDPSVISAFVASALGFLIIGGAGRKIGMDNRNVRPAWRLGALAGALSELIRILGASVVLSVLPAGQAAFARLTPQQRQQNSDPVLLVGSLLLDVAVVTLFGGLLGWLGAWSALRFGPPPGKPEL